MAPRFTTNFLVTKKIYAPGETVEGYAYLNTRKEAPARVELLVMCLEKTDSIENQDIRSGTRALFRFGREFVPADQFEKETAYCFPFSFTLPTGIPDSYTVKGDKGSASICYYVKLFVNFSKDICDLNFQTSEPLEFFVENKVPEPTEQLQSFDSEKEEGPIEVRVMNWCCFYKGSILGNVQLNQSGYKPGEKVRMHINLSESKKDLIKKKIKFEFASVVQSSGCSDFGNDLSFVSWPEDINYTLIESKEMDRNDKHSYSVEFEIPKDAEPTVIGSLSRRIHFIKICLETNGSYYTDMYCLVPVLRSKKTEESGILEFEWTVPPAMSIIKTTRLELQLPSHLNIGNDPTGLMEGHTFVPRAVLPH